MRNVYLAEDTPLIDKKIPGSRFCLWLLKPTYSGRPWEYDDLPVTLAIQSQVW